MVDNPSPTLLDNPSPTCGGHLTAFRALTYVRKPARRVHLLLVQSSTRRFSPPFSARTVRP